MLFGLDVFQFQTGAKATLILIVFFSACAKWLFVSVLLVVLLADMVQVPLQCGYRIVLWMRVGCGISGDQ
jgi:hypothetical protein